MVKGKPRAATSAAKVRCRVLAFTGLRPSELMRYRPEHWNRTMQTLVVYTEKGGRTRTIPLSAPAPEALADLEAAGTIGPFSTSTVRRAFIRAAARIGIHGVRPYDLRHSYGTALYRVASDTRLVQNVLGHSDTRMTERYTLGHVPDAMRLATSRFDAIERTADRRNRTGRPPSGMRAAQSRLRTSPDRRRRGLRDAPPVRGRDRRRTPGTHPAGRTPANRATTVRIFEVETVWT